MLILMNEIEQRAKIIFFEYIMCQVSCYATKLILNEFEMKLFVPI